MKIGIVDVDTSHPENWIPIERDLGHEVVGVWDGGTVHPAGYTEQFAAKHKVPRVFKSLEEMAGEVDCAVIHSADWDSHVPKARVFVDAGKAVLMDKPIAGNLRDMDQIRKWANAGARITGGSSLRFCVETMAWLAKPAAERGTPHTAVCGCAVDDFNYGIHAFAMMYGMLGGGAVSVRHLGKGVQRRTQVNYADGRMGIVISGQAARWIPFYATISTERGFTQFRAANDTLYRGLLEVALPYLAGKTDKPPVGIDDLLEPELCVIAAKKSWENGDRLVNLSEVTEKDSFDGKAFGEFYRNEKYPPKK